MYNGVMSTMEYKYLQHSSLQWNSDYEISDICSCIICIFIMNCMIYVHLNSAITDLMRNLRRFWLSDAYQTKWKQLEIRPKIHNKQKEKKNAYLHYLSSQSYYIIWHKDVWYIYIYVYASIELSMLLPFLLSDSAHSTGHDGSIKPDFIFGHMYSCRN